MYTTLVGMTDPPAHDALLKSALVRRAMADVQRVLRIREDKPALQNLLQKGSVGDDLWTSILAAEKEMEAEIGEVIQEANAYVEGWGSIIFQTANEMIANEKIRGLYEESLTLRPVKGELQLYIFVFVSPIFSPTRCKVWDQICADRGCKTSQKHTNFTDPSDPVNPVFKPYTINSQCWH